MAKLAAATAGSLGVSGVRSYAPPSQQVEDWLAQEGQTPEERAAERRARLITLGEGDIDVVEAG